jgi:hypothetical protein
MGSQTFQVAAAWQSFLNSQGIRDLAHLFAWNRGDRLDKPGLEGWRQRWRIKLAGSRDEPQTLYLKRFDRPPFARQWERWRSGEMCSSTAGVEWRNAVALAAAGVRAAEPVAFGQEMAGPFEVRSAILIGEAPGESLERWVPANLPPASHEVDWRNRRLRLDGLARFVARFHDAGFVHRDLYLCHIFYEPRIAQEPGRACGQDDVSRDLQHAFCLIDLQRVFRPRWRGQRWAIKDLAALDFSAPSDRVSERERLRFLCRYVRLCGRFGTARQLAGGIQARADRMRRRQARASRKSV